MATRDALPPMKEPPGEIVAAALKVRRWAEENGWQDWSIGGLEPVGSRSVTRLACNALWMLASPTRVDAAQARHLAEMNAVTIEREMKATADHTHDPDQMMFHEDCPACQYDRAENEML